MSLPILNAPRYEMELPLSKKTITYRPYLVKEEKLLMMAMESKDQKSILKTVQDIIDACTFGEIKAKDLPTSELELIFLKLRSKSVGETSHIAYECQKCGQKHEMSVNLNDIEIDTSSVAPNKIMLTDSVGVIMKYPTTSDVSKVINSNAGDIKNTFAIITSCIETIFDSNGIYQASEASKEDLESFIDSLSSVQFESIKKFFESMPKLSKDVSFTCSSCGTRNEIVLEGLQSFFG